ncbi:pyridoxamine 5'-phosphate oxidase family protein [Saccharothrix sp.]|uniref:pyridoxamine 5'-phosphate oxidase family protein n=1 Tax=Saccharothrix sp. TaxID=1873460 RepID=UPI002811E45A|nr:pyridoxamine 5'-phosphate oxidase family protein [Saccharothrix sp.]
MPQTDVDPRFGDPEAPATPWPVAEQLLSSAELYWLTTVRPDGRPHVTPLIAVWHTGALHFCTGWDERKARNLAANPQVVMTTGNNALHGGLDVVVEGVAVRVEDPATLHTLAAEWEAKYGPDWHFEVAEGGFANLHGVALVFRVEPTTAFGFAKSPYSQTRWRFPT